MLEKIELQNFLFSNQLSRTDLVKYVTKSKDKKKIKVYRNHSFELIAKTMSAYLDYADLCVDFSYSDYDDSLSFYDFENDVDAILIWIDNKRYNVKDIKSFLDNRIDDLRKKTNKPVLLGYCGEHIEFKKDGVLSFNVEELLKDIEENKLFDLRMEPFSGTRLSNEACLKLSELIGLIYIPAILKTNMKAILLDLDNTLYDGVLGEDGVEGVVLTDGHKQLQQHLKELSEKGYFLCAISKNEQKDAEELLSKRLDFPLQIKDFTKITASWNNKSEMIYDTIKFLNIGADSCLFIDDNIGEISEVSTAIPEIKYMQAKKNALETLAALKKTPGLFHFKKTNEDNLRKDDVKANAERLKIQQTLSHEDFLKQLEMQVKIICNDTDGIERIAQLSGKTNQFIFTYQRYSVNDIINIMNDNNKVVVSIHLKDKLSDSGMIGGIVLAKENNVAILEECFVSCRALGRGIDDLIVLNAINVGMKKLDVSKLKVNFIEGERNEPARLFVEKFLKQYRSEAEFVAPQKTMLVNFVYGEK